MADFSYIASPEQSSPMTSIRDMIGIGQAAQTLRSSQQEYQRGNINLQKEQQANSERTALNAFKSIPENWQDENGNIDMGKLNAAVPKIAPQTGPEFLGQMSALSNAQTQASQAKLNFSNDERRGVSQLYGVLGRAGVTDPKQVSTELDNLAALYPDNKHMQNYIQGVKVPLQQAQPGPHITDMLIKNSQSMLSNSEQQGQLTKKAGTVSLGGTVNQVTETPQVGANPPSVAIGEPLAKQTLGPGSLETIEEDANGNKAIVSRSPQGSILSTRPMPGSPAQTQPNFNLQPGDREAIPGLEAERTAARNILGSAPIAHVTNKGILDEIDKTSTGAMGPAMQKIASTLGVSFDSAEKRASAYDLVGKYLERNALEAAKAMGPHTNAGLESALAANGSVHYNPTAIKEITKLNDAITSGAEAYQPALERAIAANPNRGVLAKREFDQQWAQSFDPRIFQLENAVKAGDKAEVNRIKTQLGPQGIQQLKQKALALRTIIGGQNGP